MREDDDDGVNAVVAPPPPPSPVALGGEDLAGEELEEEERDSDVATATNAVVVDGEDVDAASIEGRCELKGTIVGGGVSDSVGGEGGGMGGRDRGAGTVVGGEAACIIDPASTSEAWDMDANPDMEHLVGGDERLGSSGEELANEDSSSFRF